MIPTVHLMTGLPASGKTTLARQLVTEANGHMKRVNMDDLRHMLDNGVYSPESERLALGMQDKLILTAVRQGYDVVVDNTHLHQRMPNRIRSVLACEDVRYQVHDLLDVPASECTRRDVERQQRGERAVGAHVINTMARKRRTWRLTEEYMTEWERPPLYVPNTRRTAAYIVDLDGTLALHTGRSPYDTARCLEDEPNDALVSLLESVAEDRVITVLLSGRDERYRDLTEEWLTKHSIGYNALFMRAEGDRRRDDIVKAEIFEQKIRDNYHVLMAFDDRDRVVNLWRSMGIVTAQMGYGDF